MTEKKFKIGDSVQLKSGSAKMTVESYMALGDLSGGGATSDTQVDCVWYSDGKVFRDTFHQDSLELYQSRGPKITSL